MQVAIDLFAGAENQQHAQIANAVQPTLARAVVRSIAEALR